MATPSSPFLSIIIPAYNSSSFIGACLESIILQHFENYEIIIVNDGSTDNTLEMCQGFAERYNNIRIISQDNAGVSAARNRGLNEAKGDIIHYVDSDDTLQPGTYSSCIPFMSKHPEIDILSIPVYLIKENRYEIQFRSNRIYYGHEQICLAYCDGSISVFLWNKLFRRRALKNVSFPVGRICEDVFVLPQICNNVRYVQSVSLGGYNHIVTRNDSLLTSMSKQRSLSYIFDRIDSTLDFFSCFKYSKKAKRLIIAEYYRLVLLYIEAMQNYRVFDENVKLHLIKEMPTMYDLIRYSSRSDYAMAAILCLSKITSFSWSMMLLSRAMTRND